MGRERPPSSRHPGTSRCACISFVLRVRSCVTVVTPPWPQWVKRLYELEQHQDPDMNVDAAAITPSAAVSAMSERMKNRLGLVSWTLGVLQELGWDISQDGDSLIAACAITPDAARASLERAGVAGPMCRICDIDADGWPLLWWNSGASRDAG